MLSTNEEALFTLAVGKPADKRAAWLDRECGGDAALLAAQVVRRDEFHESPTAGQGLTELGPPDAPDEAVGQTLGCYKLLEG